MKKVNKKKSFSFKKMFKKIGTFFKNLYLKFMALPNKLRYIIYIWSVAVILILILIFGTASNNKLIDRYQNVENIINEAALKYVEVNEIYPSRDNKLKLDVEVLKDLNYVTSKEIDDDTCEGYSLVYYDDESDSYTSKTYINCKKYTTTDYFDYK